MLESNYLFFFFFLDKLISPWYFMRPLSIPYESEVLLPICYQIFDGDPDKGVEKYFTKDWACGGLSDCEELVGDNHTEEDVSDFGMSFG